MLRTTDLLPSLAYLLLDELLCSSSEWCEGGTSHTVSVPVPEEFVTRPLTNLMFLPNAWNLSMLISSTKTANGSTDQCDQS